MKRPVAFAALAVTAVLALAVLASRTAEPPKELLSEQISERMIYFKDRFGNCFAALPSLQSDMRSVVAIAAVDCKRVGL